MSVHRGSSSPAHSFKPIPEDKVCGQVFPRRHSSSSSCNSHHDTGNTDPDPPAVPAQSTSPAQQNGDSTPEAQIQELRKLLTDWQDEGEGGRGGGGYVSGGGGSRPPSRSSLRSSSSRQGSRIGSRRGSWVASEDEDEVTGSQKAHLLVASQQRLVYTLQGLRHELASLDEEVNRIRNDVLNSRRYHNALRGVHEQPTWGSGHKRTTTAAAAATYHMGSGSSSPSMYSLDNSYSDEADSLARSESCSSFASWRSEAELFNVFKEAEEVAGLDKNSARHSIPTHGRSDTSNSNDNGCNSSGGSTGSYNSSSVSKDSGNGSSSNSQNSGSPVIRGRYRQLGTSHGTPRR